MIYHHNIDPTLIHIGLFQIRWYGLMYIIGFLAAFYFFRKFSREGILKLNYAQIDSLLFYGFLGLFVGARIFYILFYNLDYYLSNPMDMIAVWKGGLSFHGGLVGIITVIYIFAKKYSVPFWNIADTVVTCTPIGIGCGRLGNFINGELYGHTTNGSWGVVFRDGGPFPRHPSQLYESFFEGFFIFFVLYLLRGKLPSGRQSALFLLLYGPLRFAIEFFRKPDEQLGYIFYHISMGQILSACMILAGVMMWFYRRPANR